MMTTIKICVRNQRVNGQASVWHRYTCRNGIVGGSF